MRSAYFSQCGGSVLHHFLLFLGLDPRYVEPRPVYRWQFFRSGWLRHEGMAFLQVWRFDLVKSNRTVVE